MADEDPELERLYDVMAELMGAADALTPDSRTAARIAEVEAEISAIERRQADAMRAEFEAGLQMPIGSGAALAAEIVEAFGDLPTPE